MKKILLFLMLFLSHDLLAQRADCDEDISCVGRAATFSIGANIQPQYIDVEKTASQNKISDKLTIEMWVKPTRQNGKIQFLAGYWGPANDVNDVWVLYIDQLDRLTFEINSPNNNLLSVDNTIAQTDVSALYDQWYHIAALFDGASQTCRIYINGALSSAARNNLYPANRLRIAQNQELGIIIGGANSFTNDENINRTFSGQIDEVRIWSKVFSDQDIYCMKNQSLNWSIPDLIVYYRFNEEIGSFVFCDATNNGNTGMGRSGAAIAESNRKIERTVFLEPIDKTIPFVDTLPCIGSKTYRFKVRDTSSCRKTVYMDIIGNYKDDIKITPEKFVNMVKDSNYEFAVTVNADFQGTITQQLRAYSSNRCRFINSINLNLTRLSQLSLSNVNILFDSLKAGCIEKPYIDSVLTVVNQTDKSGSQKPITISSISNSLPNVFQLSHTALPYTIMPGDTFKINIRFVSGKFSSDDIDEIVILSDDFCSTERRIPLSGKVKEVIRVSKGNSEIRLDSIDFRKVCVDFPSNAELFNWMNLLEEDIFVVDIRYPEDVQGNQRLFPQRLTPLTGYMPSYFRYVPSKPGPMNDSIVIVVNSGGCTIEWKIYVKGYGLFADVQFQNSSANFGNVIVGQESTLMVPIKNFSSEQLRISFYLRKGDVFFISNTTTVQLDPGATHNIQVTFRPTSEINYTDELCFFDGRCYVSGCIPISGQGVLEMFEFVPEVLKLENVIGCQSKQGSIEIINRTPAEVTIKNINFVNPSGKFQLVNPNPIPTEIKMAIGEKATFLINYSPNETTIDRGETAEITYQTSDNTNWIAQIKGNSVSPKISAESPILYGKVEVGEVITRLVIFENISPFAITLSNIIMPDGFILMDSPSRYINKVLNIRDTIQLTVNFAPTESKLYQGQMSFELSSPCPKTSSINLEGEAEIIALEVPLNVLSYGFVMPCDCLEREVKLINRSKVFDMIIDSVYLSSIASSPLSINYFTWTSDYFISAGSILPYSIPPGKADNLKVKFCPKDIQNSSNQSHNVFLNVQSHGSAWSNQFSVYLSGMQALMYEAETDYVLFNPTRVDTDSDPQYVDLYFPNYLQNPYREAIIIDTITFVPDERVFYAYDSLLYNLGQSSYPTKLDSAQNLTLQFGFRPRSVRDYSAKAQVSMRKLRDGGLCQTIDTTIQLFGSGFAAAFGLSFNFGTGTTPQDTFRTTFCEELTIPIYSSRNIPADIVDIDFRLSYDTSKIELLSVDSPYLLNGCKGYAPSLSKNQNAIGTQLLMKNFCYVDSTKPIALLNFKSKFPFRDTLQIKMDTVFFDTEEVILYHLIAALDNSTIVILQPEIEILPRDSVLLVEFDSVRVLDCKDMTFIARNIGDVPISLFELTNMTNNFQSVSFNPNVSDYLGVGDTLEVTVRFCPRSVGNHFSGFVLSSMHPCFVFDTGRLSGIGFAPEFNPMFYINNLELMPDTLKTVIGDTLTIPIYLNRDFSDTINNIFYSMKDVDFKLKFKYNPRSMKYLSNNYSIDGLEDIDYLHGELTYNFISAKDLRRGRIVEPEFLVTVPDSVLSGLTLNSEGYQSDSVMFFDIVPSETAFKLSISDSCGIGKAIFIEPLIDIFPTPVTERLVLQIDNPYDLFLSFDIIGVTGEQFEPQVIESNANRRVFSTNNLPTGVYQLVVYHGRNRITRSFVVVK